MTFIWTPSSRQPNFFQPYLIHLNWKHLLPLFHHLLTDRNLSKDNSRSPYLSSHIMMALLVKNFSRPLQMAEPLVDMEPQVLLSRITSFPVLLTLTHSAVNNTSIDGSVCNLLPCRPNISLLLMLATCQCNLAKVS